MHVWHEMVAVASFVQKSFWSCILAALVQLASYKKLCDAFESGAFIRTFYIQQQ